MFLAIPGINLTFHFATVKYARRF